MIQTEQLSWTEAEGWRRERGEAAPSDDRGCVLVFGGRRLLEARRPLAALAKRFPDALLFGCSTAGEILDVQVSDERLVATAMDFSATHVVPAFASGATPDSSTEIGRRLAADLPHSGLRHVFVLADGVAVNASALLRGLREGLPQEAAITGGLAGDGERFESTLVLQGPHLAANAVGVLGFYGDRLRVGYGTLGGWDPFGPERRITRSAGNILYELDSRPALELYRRYLGEYAADLPAAGLRFPLSLRASEDEIGRVRTLVGYDEAAGSLTFVGDIPEGQLARLMRANLDRLIDGASGAAGQTASKLDASSADVALLVSCVGRRLVLGQRIEEEVEAVRLALGTGPALAGFYSYGEIAPTAALGPCELHNQTMTITAFTEL